MINMIISVIKNDADLYAAISTEFFEIQVIDRLYKSYVIFGGLLTAWDMFNFQRYLEALCGVLIDAGYMRRISGIIGSILKTHSRTLVINSLIDDTNCE